MTKAGRRNLRLLAAFRYPVVLALLAGFWMLSDKRMDDIAANLKSGLHDVARLEEVSRLENELAQFYTTARKFSKDYPSTSMDEVQLHLDLVWSRATALNSFSYAAIVSQAPDRQIVPALNAALPQFDDALKRLVKGKPESYKAIEALELRYAQDISRLADWAYTARRKATNGEVGRDVSTLEQVREVQFENFLAVGGLVFYVTLELMMYWLSNRKLARLVMAKRKAMRADYLTGIANRMSFEETLANCIDNPNVCVIYFDLDGFKRVNDWLGHDIGDKLLGRIAEILAQNCDEPDVAARFGGDEFAVLVRSGQPETFARRIIRQISGGFEIEGNTVSVTTSAGICSRRELGRFATAKDMMRNADLALYAAKRRGKNQMVSFSTDLLAMHDRRLTLEADIEGAIQSGTLEVAFQPIMHLASNRISGIESLVRWHHPIYGQIPPLEVCEAARSSGQLMALTLFIMKRSCQFLSNATFLDPEFRASINIAPDLLGRADFAEQLVGLVKSYSIEPKRFVMEVTEQSADVGSDEQIEQSAASLHEHGFRLAVDDFGTGQSNLVRLSEMDFGILKFDKALIDYLESSNKDVQIVGAISRLASEINIETVAEGVETKEQLAILRTIGVTFIQGYVISPPLSPTAALHFLVQTREGLALDHARSATHPMRTIA